MLDKRIELHSLDTRLIYDGINTLTPIALFVAAFGAAFGLAAAQHGLGNTTIIAMSVLVFAGAAQFAVLDLWGTHLPLLPMILTVFAINARHILMGASLYPWLRNLTPARRYGIMLVASDANWAYSMQAFSREKPGLGLLFGGGIALWFFWSVGTALGASFGSLLQNNTRLFGIDMIMGCFLLAMAIGGEKNSRMVVIWIIAAVASLFSWYCLPANSHVVVGALAGGITGTLWENHHEH
jgi:Predicted branched-chain amino acid permease (azaleucine resistance)